MLCQLFPGEIGICQVGIADIYLLGIHCCLTQIWVGYQKLSERLYQFLKNRFFLFERQTNKQNDARWKISFCKWYVFSTSWYIIVIIFLMSLLPYVYCGKFETSDFISQIPTENCFWYFCNHSSHSQSKCFPDLHPLIYLVDMVWFFLYVPLYILTSSHWHSSCHFSTSTRKLSSRAFLSLACVDKIQWKVQHMFMIVKYRLYSQRWFVVIPDGLIPMYFYLVSKEQLSQAIK